MQLVEHEKSIKTARGNLSGLNFPCPCITRRRTPNHLSEGGGGEGSGAEGGGGEGDGGEWSGYIKAACYTSHVFLWPQIARIPTCLPLMATA